MLRLVLFDLDGTLADTAPDIATAANRALAEIGRGPLPLDRVRECVSSGSRPILHLGLTPAEQKDESLLTRLSQRLLAYYAAAPVIATRLFVGLDDLLQNLATRKIIWGVVSNKPEALAQATLAGLAPQPMPACLIGGDTLPRQKPDPLPLLEACKRCGVPPDNTLYVGDARIDVLAARAASIPVAIAGFGYAPAPAIVAAWAPDYYAGNVDSLEQTLIGLSKFDPASA